MVISLLPLGGVLRPPQGVLCALCRLKVFLHVYFYFCVIFFIFILLLKYGNFGKLIFLFLVFFKKIFKLLDIRFLLLYYIIVVLPVASRLCCIQIKLIKNGVKRMVKNRLDDLLNILDCDLITDHRMTTDEIIACLGCTVDYEGEIIDSEGNYTGVFFDEID